MQNLPLDAVHHLTVDGEYSGQRLDNFLVRYWKGVPRSHIYRLLRKGQVRVNKGRVKPDYKLCANDVVRLPPVRVADRKAPPAPSDQLSDTLSEAILWEDEQLLVVNKPAGIAVHGGSGVSLGLIEALRQIKSSQKLELVHRIDRDTSGCVLVAKRRSVLKELQQQFRDKTVSKAYAVLVTGRWPNRRRQVAAPLRKNQLQSGERIVKVEADGKPALTEFAVREHFSRGSLVASLIEARPITGRTHQIRVHTRHAGNPILGDDKYGEDEANKLFRQIGLKRLFLHAEELEFQHPSLDKRLCIKAPLAKELAQVLNALRS